MATRWGCLGPGKISADFFMAMQCNLPATDHEMVAVASRDKKRAQVFADQFKFKKAYGSYEELGQDKDVEVVYIGTVHINHAQLSKMMLNAGKNVVCEKSMAVNYSDVKEVLELAKSKNLFFLEAVWTRFIPTYVQVRKELASGTLGEIKLLQSTFCFPVADVPRLRDLKLGGGGLVDIGIYTIQAACMVFKEMPESITAVGRLTDQGVDECACIILKYKNGGMASLSYSMCMQGNNCLSITGTKGIIEVENPFWSSTKVTTPSGYFEFPLKEGDYYFPNSAALHYEAAAVRECLLQGKKETEVMSWRDSDMIHQIIHEVKRQIGLEFPDVDDKLWKF